MSPGRKELKMEKKKQAGTKGSMKAKTKKQIQWLVLVALFSALAYVILFFEFPILPQAPFLKYDASDVISIVAGFILGPVAGIVVELIKALLKWVVPGYTDGWIGFIGLFAAGTLLTFGTVIIYRIKQTLTAKLVGPILGTILITGGMTLFNYFVLLPFYGIPQEAIGTMIWTAVVPFNLIKGLISSILGVTIYSLIEKRVKKYSFRNSIKQEK